MIKNPWARGPDSAAVGDHVAPAADGTKVRHGAVDGTPVRPPRTSPPDRMATVFPGVPGGAKASDSAVMLFRLRSDQPVWVRTGQESSATATTTPTRRSAPTSDARSRCTSSRPDRVLCPCHQSQFDVTDGARPVFGPATRPLPQLPIELDDEGYFIAESDFIEPVGPGFWE